MGACDGHMKRLSKDGLGERLTVISVLRAGFPGSGSGVAVEDTITESPSKSADRSSIPTIGALDRPARRTNACKVPTQRNVDQMGNRSDDR